MVWPWNFAMPAFVLILFWKPPDDPSPSTILSPGWNFSPGTTLRAAVLALFTIVPLFNFFGLWHSYLSSSLYSGTSKQGYVLEWDGSDWQITRIGNLSAKELDASDYPEERIFENVFARRWCAEGAKDAQEGYPEPLLRVDGRLAILSGERLAEFYSCNDVL